MAESAGSTSAPMGHPITLTAVLKVSTPDHGAQAAAVDVGRFQRGSQSVPFLNCYSSAALIMPLSRRRGIVRCMLPARSGGENVNTAQCSLGAIRCS
jgi:hypothetical protein